MSRFADLLNKVTNTKVQPGDETQEAKNPRNMLANAVNPFLEEYVNPVLPESAQLAIPKMTVADDKQYFDKLPEQMAGATMGSIQTAPAARFGKILQFGNQAEQQLGKVAVKPSMADLVDDVAKIGQKKQLDAASITSKFDELYGAEAAARKADMKKGLVSPDAYSSWKQEMVNKIRGQ